MQRNGHIVTVHFTLTGNWKVNPMPLLLIILTPNYYLTNYMT